MSTLERQARTDQLDRQAGREERIVLTRRRPILNPAKLLPIHLSVHRL